MQNIDKVNVRGINVIPFEDQQMMLDHLIDQNNSVVKGKLVAINAEKIILAENNDEIKQILNNSEYPYADGISVVKSIQKKYPQYQDISRIAGCDLWHALMEKAGNGSIPIFLIGGSQTVIHETVTKLKNRWSCNIVGYQDGFFTDTQMISIIERIVTAKPKIITVAMGSPRQERFIIECQKYYPEALYMGVGGTYDVFTGRVKRAPLFWQKYHLEWLYRLLSQPLRWRRQLRLVRYLYYYLFNKL